MVCPSCVVKGAVKTDTKVPTWIDRIKIWFHRRGGKAGNGSLHGKPAGYVGQSKRKK